MLSIGFWDLRFKLKGLCVIKIIGICFSIHSYFIQGNESVFNWKMCLIGIFKASDNVFGYLIKVLLSYKENAMIILKFIVLFLNQSMKLKN